MTAIDLNEPTNNGAGNANDKPRVQTKTWLNIGTRMTFTRDDGSSESVLVGTPVGLPLDTQAPMKGNTKLAKRKNGILAKFQNAALQLEEGEQRVILEDAKSGMVLWLSRVSAANAEVSDEDQSEIDKLNISFG